MGNAGTSEQRTDDDGSEVCQCSVAPLKKHARIWEILSSDSEVQSQVDTDGEIEEAENVISEPEDSAVKYYFDSEDPDCLLNVFHSTMNVEEAKQPRSI